jgi:CheY-like chemotaxis protein
MATSGSLDARDRGGEDSPSQQRLPRILIVDDSLDSANALATLCGKHGYQIQVTYDGETALEVAKTYRPEVVLLDLGMPGLDGVHLARFFREDEQLKDTVLIAVTGYADERHRIQCDAAGVDCLVSKPAAWEDLKSTIDQFWPKQKMA